MPQRAPLETTLVQSVLFENVQKQTHSLHPACALWIALLKKSSKSKFSRSGLARYALVMSFRKTDRMMQPPRHMSAISGLFNFHLYSLAACSQSVRQLSEGHILVHSGSA